MSKKYKDENRARRRGYKNPPKEHQFKPGQSGNPGGRPPGSKSLDAIVIKNLNEPISLRVNGKSKTTSAQDAIIKAQIKRALEGDTRAAKFLMDINEKAEEKIFYMEKAIEYMNKKIAQGLQKQAENERAEAQRLFDDAHKKAEESLRKYKEDGEK